MSIAKTLLQNDKLRKITIERVEKFLSHEYWNDVNLWSRLYAKTSQDSVKVPLRAIIIYTHVTI